MMTIRAVSRRLTLALGLSLLAGCAGAGQVGDILGSVLGGGQAAQLTGTVRGVDAQQQQLAIQQADGSAVAVLFDAQTKVVYQNQVYTVANLETGDQVVARLQDRGNGSYYADSIQVTQSVSTGAGTSGTSRENVQALQGTVRQVDRANGLFTLDGGNNVVITVSMPYRPSNADVTRFNNLRAGDYVRLYGVFLNNTRVELRQFY